MSIEGINRRKVYFFYFLPSFFPLLTLVYLINKYGYRFPYWDEILYVPLYTKLINGTLGLSDLAFFQNDHRPLFPRLLTLIIAWISNWNELLILYSSVAMVLLIFFILVYGKILTNQRNQNSKLLLVNLASTALISSLLFNWNQMENWVWGLQLMVYMCNASEVVCFFLLSRFELKGISFYSASILAFISTFSYAGGLLVWICALPIILYKLLLEKRRNIFPLIMWVLLAFLVWVVYFTGYSKPGISVLGEKANFVDYIRYFLLFIGGTLYSIFAPPPWHGPETVKPNWLAYVFGITGVISFLIMQFIIWKSMLIKRGYSKPKLIDGKEEFFFWNSIALFSILSGLMITYGRAGLGIGQALSSRYITISTMFWCALIGLFNFYLKEKELMPTVFDMVLKNTPRKILALTVFLALYLLLTFAPIYQNKNWHRIAYWKNLGWYALCAGYDGRLYWTDLWGTQIDFIEPKILKEEIFPIFRKYNLCGCNLFEKKEVRKNISKLYIEEAKQFISQQMWKPAICYLETALYLNPELKYEVENYKKYIPPEMLKMYEEYQKRKQ